MKPIHRILIAIMATALVGCVEWHSAGPSAEQTSIPAWRQVQPGMGRQQVYELMGKPARETEQVAEWRGPEIRKGWPPDHPATTYWRQYEASFDAQGRVTGMRDFDKTERQ